MGNKSQKYEKLDDVKQIKRDTKFMWYIENIEAEKAPYIVIEGNYWHNSEEIALHHGSLWLKGCIFTEENKKNMVVKAKSNLFWVISQ